MLVAVLIIDGDVMAQEAPVTTGGSKPPIVLYIMVGFNMILMIGVIAVSFMSYKAEKARVTIDDIQSSQAKTAGAKAGHGGAPAEGGHGGEGGHGEGGAPAATQDFDEKIKVHELEQFTANLTGTVTPKYVKMNISLEQDENLSDMEIQRRTPQIRDTILSILNSKKPADLNTPEGLDNLKNDIKKSLNVFLVTGKVRSVYITNKVIN